MSNCKVCGKLFGKTVHNKEFCSSECYSQFRKQKRIAARKKPEKKSCVFCGKDFFSKRKDAKSCGKRDMLHRPNETPTTISIDCDNCGKSFERAIGEYNRNVRNGLKQFCGYDCLKEYRGTHVWLTCMECGNIFSRYKSEAEKHESAFCSTECMISNTTFRPNGKSHYRFINGDSSYRRGPGWNVARRKVRERDNFTCQICGITEKETGKALDVHHIVPYRNFEDSKEANRIENLISLCSPCHHREEAEQALLRGTLNE